MKTFDKSAWVKVTKANPCPICKKPDWCVQGAAFTNCMRLESSRPCKNGGWLHPLDSAPVPFVPFRAPLPSPTIDAQALWDGWKAQSHPERLAGLALAIGLTVQSLELVGCVWAGQHQSWAFPMFGADGEACGIRLRKDTGAKFAVLGSKQGLFIPAMKPEPTCYICEGPTDTSAALAMGLYAVGRPSCSGGVDILSATLERLGSRRIVFLADNDGPGIAGAKVAAAEIKLPSAIVLIPSKDVRDFYNRGGKREIIECILKNVVWKFTA